MTLFLGKLRNETTRRPNFDYSSEGFYFISVCTKNRRQFFGSVNSQKGHYWGTSLVLSNRLQQNEYGHPDIRNSHGFRDTTTGSSVTMSNSL